MYTEQKIFKYRYDFQPKNLLLFIGERYAKDITTEESSLVERIQLNGKPITAETIVNQGDWIEYTHFRKDERKIKAVPPIIYEDEDLVAISKPDYLPVIPNTNYYYTSLAILMKERFNSNDIGPVHRLDIETSGVLLFGKSKKARADIQILFQNREIEKEYQAIVFNRPKKTKIEGDLVVDAKSKIYTRQVLKASATPSSQTIIKDVAPWGDYYRVWVKPLTGRTNQIRAHLAAIDCPIVGDKKYYPDESVFLDWFAYRDIKRVIAKLILERQALHCESLSFIHPYLKKQVTISDISGEWESKINTLINTDS